MGSFVCTVTDPDTGVDVSPVKRVQHLLSEHLDSAPAVLLVGARTSTIRLNSAVTVLCASDPVRVFQEFATLDLISQGRNDLVVCPGSFTEAFPLFGLDLTDYEELFAEKLELLLQIRDNPAVILSGRHRPPLTG